MGNSASVAANVPVIGENAPPVENAVNRIVSTAEGAFNNLIAVDPTSPQSVG